MKKHSIVALSLVIFTLALATVVMAADPSVGTWKLNLTLSKIPPSPKGQADPKEETLVVRELGDQIETTVTGIRTDGSAISEKYTYAKQGGVIKRQPALPEGFSAIETLVDLGNWYLVILQNGNQVEVFHEVVSKDGKSLRETIKGTDAEGKPIEGLEVWEIQ